MAQQTQPQKSTAAKEQTAAAKAVMTGSVEEAQQEQGVTAEERHCMIAEAAYRIAEQRGFQGDMAMDDWLQAEAEVNTRFEARH